MLAGWSLAHGASSGKERSGHAECPTKASSVPEPAASPRGPTIEQTQMWLSEVGESRDGHTCASRAVARQEG